MIEETLQNINVNDNTNNASINTEINKRDIIIKDLLYRLEEAVNFRIYNIQKIKELEDWLYTSDISIKDVKTKIKQLKKNLINLLN